MSKHVVSIRAPSRLHFGMLSFGDPSIRQHGGVGVMIDAPGIELNVSAADRLTIDGPHRGRVEQIVRCWAGFHRRNSLPACRVRVSSAPRQHVGLGAGTQLALSVATGLNRFFEVPDASISDLARSAGRGHRSSIGTYGFRHGGLIAELGKREDETLAPLERVVSLHPDWRFVLLLPTEHVGLSGDEEKQAFSTMEPVPRQVTEQLTREMLDCLLPAAEQGDFDRFGESIYRYGVTAGRCFAQRQAGAFATEQLAEWIRLMRHLGVRGVGQSSWGPTLFATLASEGDARQLVRDLRPYVKAGDVAFTITPVCDGGAVCIRQTTG